MPRRRLTGLACGVVSMLAGLFPTGAATYTVTTTADSGAGSLRQAIADANANPGADAITFAAGLAGQTISLGTAADDLFGPSALRVNGPISIDGGTSGITLARDASAAPNRLRLFYVAPGGSLTLNRITLTGGLAQGTKGVNGGGGGAGLGGAIVNAGQLILQNCTLHGNTAMGADSSTGTLVGEGIGGGMGRVGAPGTFGNGGANSNDFAARIGGFGGGGGAGFASTGGDGGFGGGGAWGAHFSGDPGLGATVGYESYARTGGAGAGMGGAIFNYGGAVQLSNTTLAGNSAIGGLLNTSYFGFSYRACGIGGAIFNLNGSIVATNTTIARNQVNEWWSWFPWNLPAGGIFNLGDNGVGTQDGPALPSTPASVHLVNCIVAGSLQGNGSPVSDYLEMGFDSALKAGHAAGSATSSGSNNVIQNLAGSFGGGYTLGDPLLGTLGNNGGPTPTVSIASAGPAYNAGSDAQAPATDQRGVARPQAGRSDIGAFEQENTLLPTTLSVTVPPPVPSGIAFAAMSVLVQPVGTSILPLAGTLTLTVQGYPATSQTLSTAQNGATSFNVLVPDAGSHPFTLVFVPNNYGAPAVAWLGSTATGTLVVDKAVPTITVTRATAVHDGQPKTAEAIVKGTLGNTLAAASIQYWSWNGSAWVPESSPTAIGFYNATASWTSTDPNYSDPQPVTFAFEIMDPSAASLVVTTLVDEDDGDSNPAHGTGTSLREAVNYTRLLGGDLVVSFSPTLFASGPRTIYLTLGQISFENRTGKTTIAGPGASLLTIDGSGNGTQRILQARDQVNEINGITFANGRGTDTGSAIYAGGTFFLNDCHFTRNGSPLARGGAVFVAGESRIRRCTFAGNNAGRGGAIGVDERLVLVDCTFHGNTADAGNGTGEGGAIWSNESASMVRAFHCTFTGNSAVVAGGAVYHGNGRPILVNSIVSGNSAPANSNVFLAQPLAFPSAGNLIDVSTANIFATGLLADHGGPTPTIALKPGGLAIDAGSNAQSVEWTSAVTPTSDPISIDQRGAPRNVGGVVDIGAYEAPAVPVLASPFAASITSSNATLGATVVAGTFTPVTARGFVYARTADNPNPTRGGLSVTEIVVPGFAGSFTSPVPALASLTGYSFAAFAVNETGTAYSSVVTFQTAKLDSDGDTLADDLEIGLGANPQSIDSDGDGFNDATEVLVGTSPTSPASLPASTRVERVLGFGPARGLDLLGTFLHAFNVGPAGAAGQVGDALFTADTAAGITVAATDAIADWNAPSFGSTAGDDVLETVFRSIRWANHLSGDPEARKLKVDLAGLTPGRRYKLQLLFGEAGATGRRFDVFVDGTLVVDDFSPTDAQGGVPLTTAGSAIVHEFDATASVLHVVLDGTDVAAVPDLNRDPYLNGATLEVLPSAPVARPDTITRPEGARVVKVLPSALLSNDTDADGDPLALASVGGAQPAGATVALVGGFVVYTAPATGPGSGSFTYVIHDGSGGFTATGVVTVHGAASATASATPNAVGITPQGGDIVVAFVGLPGGSYRVQFTDDTSPPYAWQEFSPPAVHVAAPNGVFSHTDVAPSSPARLYRAVLNP